MLLHWVGDENSVVVRVIDMSKNFSGFIEFAWWRDILLVL
jgi:hypothetical protein